MLVALYDGKGSLVLMILHHEPRNCLLVFAVHTASFDELVVQFGDGLDGVLGVEVDDDSVDHVCYRECPSGVYIVLMKLCL